MKRLVVDTDVVAAALLGETRAADEATRLLAWDGELAAPSHWRAELANVLWKAVRLGRLAVDDLGRAIDLADAIPIVSVDVAELWRGALGRAVSAGHPAYDALFVELAARLDTVVASYDRKLQRRFPAYVRAPREVLHSLV